VAALFRRSWAQKIVGAWLVGCAPSGEDRSLGETAPPESEPAATAPEASAAPAAEELVLVAGGDVSFGRALGDALLADPAYDFFAPTAAILASADVRFVNL
jgi:hypothetical protein